MKVASKSTILVVTVLNVLSFVLLLAIANAQIQKRWKFREDVPFFHILETGEFFYDPLWIPLQFERDIPGYTNTRDFNVIAEDGKLSGRKEFICEPTGEPSYWDIQGTYIGDQYEFTIVDNCSGCDPAPCEHRQPWTVHATGQLKGSKIEGVAEGGYTVFWPYRSIDYSNPPSRNDTQVWTWTGTWTVEERKPRMFGLFVGVRDLEIGLNKNMLLGDEMAMALEKTFRETFQHFNMYGGSRVLSGIVSDNGGLTSDDVKNAIGEMMEPGNMRPGDLFWLYIVAHGGSADTGTETSLNPGNEGVRLGWKSQAFAQGNGTLTDDDLYQVLNATDAAGDYGKTIIIDSCHSGGFWSGDLSKLKNVAFVAAAWEACSSNGTECLASADPSSGFPLLGIALNDAMMLEYNIYMKGDTIEQDGILSANEIVAHFYKTNEMRTGFVFEMAFGDAVEFSPDLLNSQLFVSDDFTGNVQYVTNITGTIGTQISITGTDFGARKGKVTVGGKPCNVSEWNNESITCIFKTALPSPGPYNVAVKPKEPKGAQTITAGVFTMMAPEITSVVPGSGVEGAVIEITGTFFNTKKGKVYLGDKKCKVLLWEMNPGNGRSRIQFVVPARMTPGPYNLTIANKVGSTTLTDGFTIP